MGGDEEGGLLRESEHRRPDARKPASGAAGRGWLRRFALSKDRAYARAFDKLLTERGDKHACRTMVGLLALAHDRACEAELAAAIDASLAVGELPDLDRLRERFRPHTVMPAVAIDLAPLSAYDELASIGSIATPAVMP